MAIRGISVDRVCSEMGALGADRKNLFSVEHGKLVKGLCSRFDATEIESENAIQRAKDCYVIKEKDGYLSLLSEEEKKIIVPQHKYSFIW